jgi:hypothetical protein
MERKMQAFLEVGRDVVEEARIQKRDGQLQISGIWHN